MGRKDHQGNRDVGTLQLFIIAVICAVVLILAGQKTGWISKISQEIITFTLELSGLFTETREGGFQAGKIWVPWSPGCSGYNGLIFCVILTVWLDCKQKIPKNFIYHLLACIPAALAANTLRILFILGYRFAFYPENETPELHFLIGFLTLLPCIYLLNYRKIHSISRFQRIEILYLAALFSLLIPVTWEPGGWGIAFAGFSIIGLYQAKSEQPKKPWLVVGWVLLGLLIGLAQMESMWLPWMLLCPLLLDIRKMIKRPPAWILLLSTFSLAAMLPYWPIILIIGLIIEWSTFKHSIVANMKQKQVKPIYGFICFIGLSFPFVLPLVPLKSLDPEQPPDNAIVTRIDENMSMIRFIGQQDNLRIYWFNSPNQGRHHGAAICMQFSGSKFDHTSTNLLVTDTEWMTERFMLQGKCLDDYQSYLFHTWLPWSQCGAHVIISGDKEEFGQIAFETAATEAVERWFK